MISSPLWAAMIAIRERALSRLPEVTLGFWIIKILATTLGETGGDAVTMSLNFGYWVGSPIFAVVFALAVMAQIRATAAFILTRPLGATVGDLLDKPLSQGGLALGRCSASAVIAMLIVACILLLPQRAERRTVV